LSDSPSHSVPSWVWLFTGVATGLFLAFLYYLAGIQTPIAEDTKQSGISQRHSSPQDTAKAPAFDFYNVLPDVEVNTAKGKGQISSKTINDKTAIEILLQTGAFTLPKDADKRRAELLLLGLNVNIEAVDIKGKTYHRVQVGPFTSNAALDNAKLLLKQNSIEHLQRQKPTK
jgi:cell division protein FtsN